MNCNLYSKAMVNFPKDILLEMCLMNIFRKRNCKTKHVGKSMARLLSSVNIKINRISNTIHKFTYKYEII